MTSLLSSDVAATSAVPFASSRVYTFAGRVGKITSVPDNSEEAQYGVSFNDGRTSYFFNEEHLQVEQDYNYEVNGYLMPKVNVAMACQLLPQHPTSRKKMPTAVVLPPNVVTPSQTISKQQRLKAVQRRTDYRSLLDDLNPSWNICTVWVMLPSGSRMACIV